MDNNMNPQPKLRKIKKIIRRNPDGSIINPSVPPMPHIEQINLKDVDQDINQYLNSTSENRDIAIANPTYNNEVPEFVEEYDDMPQSYPMMSGLDAKKLIILTAVVAFIIGFIFAKVFTENKKIVKDGLQGVVVNREVPKGRPRCGIAERAQGCVLYIMNPQKRDLPAKDFYKLASQLTGRDEFLIQTGNIGYADQKIRPGEIGQFNIPPLTYRN